MVRYALSGHIPVPGALRGHIPVPDHFKLWYIECLLGGFSYI